MGTNPDLVDLCQLLDRTQILTHAIISTASVTAGTAVH